MIRTIRGKDGAVKNHGAKITIGANTACFFAISIFALTFAAIYYLKTDPKKTDDIRDSFSLGFFN